MIDSVSKQEVSVESYFKVRENCIQDIHLARDVFQNRNVSRKQWEGAERGLFFMLLYCPDDLVSIVQATLDEMGRREVYMLFNGNFKLSQEILADGV